MTPRDLLYRETTIKNIFFSKKKTWIYHSYFICNFKDRTLKKILLKGRGFRCGSDEKLMRMCFGLEIDVVALPPLIGGSLEITHKFHLPIIPRPKTTLGMFL